MGAETVYQLHLESSGVPEDLSRIWASSVARRDSIAPADQLALGLYRYFVGGSGRG